MPRGVWALVGATLLMSAGTSTIASTNVTFVYDAKGRLLKVVRAGLVNNGV